MTDEERNELYEHFKINEDLVMEKPKHRAGSIVTAVILILVQLGFLWLVLLTVGGPL